MNSLLLLATRIFRWMISREKIEEMIVGERIRGVCAGVGMSVANTGKRSQI